MRTCLGCLGTVLKVLFVITVIGLLLKLFGEAWLELVFDGNYLPIVMLGIGCFVLTALLMPLARRLSEKDSWWSKW